MSKNKKSKLTTGIGFFSNTNALCAAALLAAICVAMSYICKAFTVTMSVRITFENLPLIFSGMILGPYAGLLTGLCADLVSTAVSYGIGGINPVLTVGAASVGFFAGILSSLVFTKKTTLHTFLIVFISHAVGNMLIKTLGLWFYYKTSPLELCIRMIVYIGIATAEAFILNEIFKSKGIKKVIGALKL